MSKIYRGASNRNETVVRNFRSSLAPRDNRRGGVTGTLPVYETTATLTSPFPLLSRIYTGNSPIIASIVMYEASISRANSFTA